MDDILHIKKYPSWDILWNKFGRHQISSFRIAVCVSAVDYKENNYDLLVGKTVKVMEWQRGMICNKYWHHFWKYVHVMKNYSGISGDISDIYGDICILKNLSALDGWIVF